MMRATMTGTTTRGREASLVLASRRPAVGTRRAERLGRSFLRVVPRAAGGGDKENLPRGWTGYDDPKSGDRYYFNEETGKTQWEKPGEASDAAESRGRSEEELESMEARLGIGKRGRENKSQQQQQAAGATLSTPRGRAQPPKVVWKEGSLTPEGWDDMSIQERVVEGLWGEKGFLYWLNYLSYRLIFVMIGGWILFRFIGPALNVYQLTNPFDLSNVPL